MDLFRFILASFSFFLIIEFCSERPLISVLFVFISWVNGLPLPEDSFMLTDNSVGVLNFDDNANLKYKDITCHSIIDEIEFVKNNGNGRWKSVLDKNQNPILLVDTRDPSWCLTRVEFDQTASHIHHAPDLGIKLPSNFDMTKYRKLSYKPDRVAYAKKNLSKEIITSYQYAIAESMQPMFGKTTSTMPIPGMAGRLKNPVGIIIQQNDDIPNKNIISVINDRHVHVSSYNVTRDKLDELLKSVFEKKRDYN